MASLRGQVADPSAQQVGGGVSSSHLGVVRGRKRAEPGGGYGEQEGPSQAKVHARDLEEKGHVLQDWVRRGSLGQGANDASRGYAEEDSEAAEWPASRQGLEAQ